MKRKLFVTTYGRVLCLVIAMIFAMFTFAGCGTPSATTEESAAKDTDKPSDSVATDAAETAAPEGDSWTWDTSPVTLTWYCNEEWYSYDFDEEDNFFCKAFFEKTGVKLDVQSAVGSSGSEKLNAMIAADDMPDLVNTAYDIMAYSVCGKFSPIMDLVDEYAPTFKEDIPEEMIGFYTASDGKWYAFMNGSCLNAKRQEETGVNFPVMFGNCAREDIMEELGIAPEYLNSEDGLYEALQKVKGYQYDGKNVVPMLGIYTITLFWDAGVPKEGKDGAYLEDILQPEYLNRIVYLNKLYREGLITSELFTITNETQIEEYIESGTVFCVIGNVNNHLDSFSRLKDQGTGANMIPVGPFLGPEGTKPSYPAGGVGWQATMISNSSEHQDRAIRLLEFMYGLEGNTLNLYGVEGVHYDMVNGRVKYRDEYLNAQAAGGLEAEKYALGLYLCFDSIYQYYVAPEPETTLDKKKDEVFSYFAQYAANTVSFDNLDPLPGTEEAEIQSKCEQIWQLGKLVLADSEEECISMYNEMVASMKDAGIEQLVAYRNEKFQANKDKMGEEFAWAPNK